MTRPRYCEECPLYPRRCSGADCYYDYLDALAKDAKQGCEEQNEEA